MTVPLVQAVKEFRAQQTRPTPEILLQNITWDLDRSFVGKSLNSSLVTRMSEYVDRKLEEYSAIYGSQAATRTVLEDEHYAHGSEQDAFLRRSSAVDAEPVAEDDAFERTLNAVQECVKEARSSGIVAGAVYGDNVDYPDAHQIHCDTLPLAIEPDESDENEAEEPVRVSNPLSIQIGVPTKECTRHHVVRVPETTIETFRIDEENVKVANYVTRQQDSSEETYGHRYRDQEVRTSDNATRTLRLHDNSVYDQSWMANGSLDAVVNTQGLLPEVPNRVKDTLVRPVPSEVLRTQDLREILTPVELNGEIAPTRIEPYIAPKRPKLSATDTTSYVTSYNIDHTTLKITARVITVPSYMKIDYGTWFDCCFTDGKKNPQNLKEVIRNTVKANLTIMMKESRRTEQFENIIDKKINETEQKALDTLREMITEEEFKKYLRYGFMPVKGKSGDTYQVFRNQSHTKVWRNGQVIEEICIRIHGAVKVPLTDNVIAFMTMISADEEEFKKMGNRYIMKKVA
jgi:hypothetical protein